MAKKSTSKRRRSNTPAAGTDSASLDCAINKLPNELLSRIFLFAASNLPLTEWVPALTHVCRLWRQLAVALSGLWTTISFENYDNFEHWVGTLINSRSCGKPLAVDCSIDWPEDWCAGDDCLTRYMEVLGQTSEEMHRVERIRLEGDQYGLHNVAEFYSTLEAPELKELSFSVTKYRGHDETEVPQGTKLFNGVHPKLTSLYLSGTKLNWELWKPMLRMLKRLTIVQSNTKLELGSTVLREVSKMPRLEYLELGDVFYDLSRGRRPAVVGPNVAIVGLTHGCLVFPQLRELRIHSHIVSLNTLLPSLSTPQLRRFGLSFHNKKPAPIEALLTNLSDFLRKFDTTRLSSTSTGHAFGPNDHIRHLDLIFEEQLIHINGRSWNPFYNDEGDDGYIFSLSFMYKKSNWTFIGEALDKLPITDVESLRIQVLHKPTFTAWGKQPGDNFVRLTELAKLHTIDIWNEASALQLLSTSSEETEEDLHRFDTQDDNVEAKARPFPSLETLMVHFVRFKEFAHVEKLLKDKERGGNLLRRVQVVDCEGLDDDHIAAIKKHTVDGIEVL